MKKWTVILFRVFVKSKPGVYSYYINIYYSAQFVKLSIEKVSPSIFAEYKEVQCSKMY